MSTTSSSSVESILAGVPYRRRNTCRLCGSPELTTALSLVPTPIGDDFVPAARLADPQPTCPLELMLCASCGHVQLLNVVEADAIYREYTYTSSVSLGLVEHFERYADDAAVAAHRTSEAMAEFRVALRGAGISPQITFLTPLAGVGV